MAITRKESLTSWMKDAHAMKSARIENLDRQMERYADFPNMQSKLREHVDRSRKQVAEIESCLERLGTDASALKEASSKVASKLQGWTTATAPDEVVKNAIANEAFAEFEAASFESLAVAAAQCGEEEIAQICARMRDEERQVADWFRNEISEVTRSYLAQQAPA